MLLGEICCQFHVPCGQDFFKPVQEEVDVSVNVPFAVWWLVDVRLGGGGFLVLKFHKTRPGSNTCVPLLEHPNIITVLPSCSVF